MTWKYLIRVLGNPQFSEIRVDSWQELLEELEELQSEQGSVVGVFDQRGNPVPV